MTPDELDDLTSNVFGTLDQARNKVSAELRAVAERIKDGVDSGRTKSINNLSYEISHWKNAAGEESLTCRLLAREPIFLASLFEDTVYVELLRAALSNSDPPCEAAERIISRAIGIQLGLMGVDFLKLRLTDSFGDVVRPLT